MTLCFFAGLFALAGVVSSILCSILISDVFFYFFARCNCHRPSWSRPSQQTYPSDPHQKGGWTKHKWVRQERETCLMWACCLTLQNYNSNNCKKPIVFSFSFFAHPAENNTGKQNNLLRGKIATYIIIYICCFKAPKHKNTKKFHKLSFRFFSLWQFHIIAIYVPLSGEEKRSSSILSVHHSNY